MDTLDENVARANWFLTTLERHGRAAVESAVRNANEDADAILLVQGGPALAGKPIADRINTYHQHVAPRLESLAPDDAARRAVWTAILAILLGNVDQLRAARLAVYAPFAHLVPYASLPS